uniref:Uncharacterized protein n=1 Tax=Anguilla anguilla TaxID=7936 RepID=A0A0E9VHM9_ANGAN
MSFLAFGLFALAQTLPFDLRVALAMSARGAEVFLAGKAATRGERKAFTL